MTGLPSRRRRSPTDARQGGGVSGAQATRAVLLVSATITSIAACGPACGGAVPIRWTRRLFAAAHQRLYDPSAEARVLGSAKAPAQALRRRLPLPAGSTTSRLQGIDWLVGQSARGVSSARGDREGSTQISERRRSRRITRIFGRQPQASASEPAGRVGRGVEPQRADGLPSAALDHRRQALLTSSSSPPRQPINPAGVTMRAGHRSPFEGRSISSIPPKPPMG